jgi:hypothetical protein
VQRATCAAAVVSIISDRIGRLITLPGVISRITSSLESGTPARQYDFSVSYDLERSTWAPDPPQAAFPPIQHGREQLTWHGHLAHWNVDTSDQSAILALILIRFSCTIVKIHVCADMNDTIWRKTPPGCTS